MAGLVTLLSLTSCACGEKQEDGAGAVNATAANGREDPQAGGAARAPGAGDGTEAAATLYEARYQLAIHIARAELRQGRAWVVDFGTPAAAQHTLGGWQTRVGEDAIVDGVTVSVIPGVTAKMVLPRVGPGPHKLHLRLRAVRDGRLTVYIGEQTVAHAQLPTDGTFADVEVDVPPGLLATAEAFLALRVPSTGVVAGVGTAGMLVDWMRLAPTDDEGSRSAPPSPAELRPADDRLAIPAGWSLAYTFDIPPGARLRGRTSGTGRLRVVAHRDGHEPRILALLEGGSEEATPRDVDLDSVAGDLARIELQSLDGPVEFLEPVIVAPAAEQVVSPSRRRPRNVLVYLIDTLRADKLGPYSPETRVRTPGLDGFVGRARVFARGHSQENWTKPSVATLLSGLLPWEHHATTDEAALPGSVEILSERLQADGFHTGAFIANGYVSDKFGFRQGWSTYRNYIREGRRTQAEFVAADVLQWLDARPDDKPFFLYVHTIDPHVPYMPPDETLALYDSEPYEGIVDFGRDRELLEKIKSGSVRLNERDKIRLEALYDAEITYHDVHFDAIIQGIERRGLANDTMVVLTADHGEEFFDHGSVGHGHSVYEELLHVPLIVRLPGVTDVPLAIDDAVGLVDVAPTILDALGKDVPDEMSGESMLPLLAGQQASAPRVALSGFMDGWRTLVVGRHKLIQRTAGRVMVYDLTVDPGEENDLSASRPIAVRYLRGLLGLALRGAHQGRARRRGVDHAAETAEIDAETDAQLRALGYVGGSRPR